MRVSVLLGAVAAIALVIGSQRLNPPTVAAQGARERARIPVADEYYPVKTDWIGADRSIRTIKHGPTGSCYILIYPSGDTLQPVDKDRCNAPSAALEK